MGETGKSLIYPTKENIVRLNISHINRTGGNHSGAGLFHNEDSLNWALEAIQSSFFGEDVYPTIAQKAGTLTWSIINSHVFLDGNKRTGMSTLMIFLEINNFDFQVADEGVISTAIRVANAHANNYSKEMFIEWIDDHIL